MKNPSRIVILIGRNHDTGQTRFHKRALDIEYIINVAVTLCPEFHNFGKPCAVILQICVNMIDLGSSFWIINLLLRFSCKSFDLL